MKLQIRTTAHRRLLKPRVVPQSFTHNFQGNEPAHIKPKTNRIEFKRTLQRVPNIAALVTRAGPSPAVVTNPVPFVTHYKAPHRPLQPEYEGLVGWWGTSVAGVHAAEPATIKFPRVKRVEFVRTFKRVPTLSYFAPTPAISAQPVSAFVQKTGKTRNHSHHHRLRVVQPSATPLKSSTAPVTAFALKKAIRAEYKRQLRVALDTPGKPLPPVSTSKVSGPSKPFAIRMQRSRRLKVPLNAPGALGVLPAVAAQPATIQQLKPFKIEWKTRLLRSPIHNEYPVAPPSAASVSALFRPKPVQMRRTKGRGITFTGVIVDTLTAVRGEAGIVVPQVFRRRGWLKHRRNPVLGYYLPKTPIAEQPVSAFKRKIPFVIEQRRILRRVPVLSYFKTTPATVVAFTRVKALRVEYKRTLRVPPRLDQWTETPPRPFTFAALIKPLPRRRRDTKRILRTALWQFYHEAPNIGAAFRTGFGVRRIYLSAQVYDAVYANAEITTDQAFRTSLGMRTIYLEGELVDVIYFDSEFI